MQRSKMQGGDEDAAIEQQGGGQSKQQGGGHKRDSHKMDILDLKTEIRYIREIFRYLKDSFRLEEKKSKREFQRCSSQDPSFFIPLQM